MKRKSKLRGWVVTLLLAINFTLVFYMAMDCEDLFTFTISKIICIAIFLFNFMILNKYSDLFD